MADPSQGETSPVESVDRALLALQALARAGAHGMGLAEVAALVALCGAADELVHLGVLSGTHVVYLDKVEPERSVRVWSAVGRRSAAVTTALGRALLAYRGTDRSTLPGYVRAARAQVAVDADHVWSVLERARRQGYATEEQENEAGISCVAVPLLRSGVAIAAVSITAPAERMTAERIAWLHGQMQDVLPPLLPAGLTLPDALT